MINKGSLIVISGPAGSGKGSVVKGLLAKSDKFSASISTTSRPPRGDDVDGVTYNFVTRDEFSQMISRGELAEYAEYVGNYYGTPVSTINSKINDGMNLILEIEYQGALQIKAKFPSAILIWLCPPNYTTLASRLRGRGTNSEDDIKKRLATAIRELQYLPFYDYIVVNHDGKLDETVTRVEQIVDTQSYLVKNNPDFLNKFFEIENKL